MFDKASDGPRRLGARELEVKRRALTGLGTDADAAAHPADELAADVQPQPGAARDLSLVWVRAVELLEDRPLLGRRDSDPLVLDLDPRAGRGATRGDGDRSAAWRVLDRVVDQVEEHLLDPVAVAHRGGVGVDLRGQRDRPGQLSTHRLDGTANDLREVEPLTIDRKVATIETARQEHLLGDLSEPRRLRVDHLEELLALCR